MDWLASVIQHRNACCSIIMAHAILECAVVYSAVKRKPLVTNARYL